MERDITMAMTEPVKFLEPANIIDSAIRRALWFQIEYPMQELGKRVMAQERVPRRSVQDIAIRSTDGKCYDASALALSMIASHRSATELFDRYLLVSTWIESMLLAVPMPEHAYLFVREKNRVVWHAGSPANFTDTPNPRALKRISGTLPEVLAGLEFYNGSAWRCAWPTASDLAEPIQLAANYIPRFVPHEQFVHAGVFHVFSVQWHENGITWSPETYSVDFDKGA